MSRRICVGLAALGVTAMSGCLSSEFGVAPTDESNPSTTLTRDSGTLKNSSSDDIGSLDDDAATSEDSATEVSDADTTTIDDAVTPIDTGVVDSGVADSGVVPLTPLISVPRPGGGAAFSIEAKEVSQKQYEAFLVAKGASVSGQVASCSSNTSYLPLYNWDPTTTPNRPVVGVDLCDARAYCAWAGRHVCGGFGGTSLANLGESSSTTKSEWAIACTKGGVQTYPYSAATNDDTACLILKAAATRADDVGTHAKCVGGYAGLYDMVGNVSEWVDACNPDGSCAIMGGSWQSGTSPVPCSITFGGPGTGRFNDLGFRCCKD